MSSPRASERTIKVDTQTMGVSPKEEFLTVMPDQIKIGPRIRSEVGELGDLVESIGELGILQPIGVTPSMELIFGERRLKAWQKKFPGKPISVQVLNLDMSKRRLAELVENVQRHNLSWQDEQRAIAGVDRFGRELYGELKAGRPSGNVSKFDTLSPKWTDEKTAQVLNIPRSAIVEAKSLVSAMEKHPEIKEKKTRSTALQEVKRLEAKERGEERYEWLQYYTNWSIRAAEPEYIDPDFPSILPAQIIRNLLYYFTKEGDLVVDPMAGSGLVYKIALEMKRHCVAYDLTPRKDFITRHDILDGIPSIDTVDLLFLDPPYHDAINYGTDVERGSVQEFYTMMRSVARNCSDLKAGGKVAYIILDITEKGWPPRLLTLELFDLFKTVPLTPIANISCPLTPSQYDERALGRAKAERRMLGLVRNLVVFQK